MQVQLMLKDTVDIQWKLSDSNPKIIKAIVNHLHLANNYMHTDIGDADKKISREMLI